jgi:hypothetical protein
LAWQVAHKFNVKSALQYCDNFLAQKADEDESFLQLTSVSASIRPSCALGISTSEVATFDSQRAETIQNSLEFRGFGGIV